MASTAGSSFGRKRKHVNEILDLRERIAEATKLPMVV
jgi:hypothetical protein